MKKAIFFYGGFVGRGGGAFTHAEMFIPVLKSQGWAVSTFTLDDLPIIVRYLPHFVEKIVNFFRPPIGFIYKARLTKIFYKLIFYKSSDLCIFEDIYLSWNMETDAVTILHAVWSDNLQAFDVAPARRASLISEEVKLINSIRHPVITVSEPYHEYLTKKHFSGELVKPIHVVELGVNQEAFRQISKTQRVSHSLIYCGALEARKNVMFLLIVFKLLFDDDNRYTLAIAGEGPDKKALVKFSVAHGLPVDFLGRLDNQVLVRRLYEYEIYLHTSVKESFSFSLLEAKLAGLKTCAYANLDVPEEFVDSKVEGFIAEEWADSIRKLSNLECSFQGKSYSSERMVSRTLEIAKGSE